MEAKVFSLDASSLDGTKLHADASKRQALSYGHLVNRRAALEAEVDELLTVGAAAAAASLPASVTISAESERRRQALTHLTQAEAVLQVRAEER
ncbi:MAG: hypothetical protein H7Z11_14700 [Verrucomicrobia bacterium]|nr:hypothetical protein [Leptolyngbya sp. ES-bin-22]